MKRNIKGLTEAEVEESRRINGDNSLVREGGSGFFKKFFENLTDPIIKVLLIAVFIEVIFTLGRCNWWETGGIIVAVLIATTVSTVSEYGSERAFLKMEEESNRSFAKVFRDGVIKTIPINEIVVGDILYLSSGEIASADGEVIEGNITVDQSALNGESKEVLKHSGGDKRSDNFSSSGFVFRGSIVCDGSCVILVKRVGKDTYYGMVAKDVQSETRESPLKLRLTQLAASISKIGYFMAFLVGFCYVFCTVVVDNGYSMDRILSSLSDLSFAVSTVTHALTLMITVIVVAVPEGLPMMITVVLSANMKKMLRDKVMVKKLVGIETAGSMNILFTDKTGTLTTGKTSVDTIISCDGAYKNAKQLKSHGLYNYVLACADLSDENRLASANNTDKALFEFFKGEDPIYPKISGFLPFRSDRKYSSVTLLEGITVIKGAPEILIPSCKAAIDKNGNEVFFDPSAMMHKYRALAEVGERAISLIIEENGERKFLALAVLKDKVRAGVKEAVASIRSAGVKVVMITGDGRETALAIAKECGIIDSLENYSVLTHDELETMSDAEVKEYIPNLAVVARAHPRDKSRLVRLSQELGLVVGMTGDGINDAPSLKISDVGFAMGSGTDIAKSAGDIVILDNSFVAITKTVLYGRTIFKSIRKFISFQLMMNLTACGISLIGQILGIETPITIVQMLWINIIMDTLGGLAFAGEPPLDYYMMEKPKSREEKILTHDMLSQIFLSGGYTLILAVMFLKTDVIYSLFRYDPDGRFFLTGFYAFFVFAGIFNCFTARSERVSLLSNISKNKPFIVIMLFISTIQLFMIYFGGELFRSSPLTFRELLNVILIAASVIPFDMIRRVLKKLK